MPSEDVSPPRFLVVQYGARRAYAVPSAFARAGALAGVYTDLVATPRIGAMLAELPFLGKKVTDALSRRQPPAEISSFVHSFKTAFLAGEAVRTTLRNPLGEMLARRLTKGLSERAMVAKGTCGATHVYTMLGEGGRLVQHANANGLGVVSDVYIALSADRIVANETQLFPDWHDGTLRGSWPVERSEQNSTLLAKSHLFVCPSNFVRDDLVAQHGVAAERTIVVPYAVNPKWLSLETNVKPGRVLFAGTANLRKGIHYLAAAATRLKNQCRVRVAGAVTDVVRRHEGATNLTFLGHLGLKEMADEFAQADVFAFPSLAEGSAGVTAEALGAGVPVVTTRAAGSIVRNGVDGIIVPERDPDALADAIASIVGNRARRDAMSYAARRQAQAITWDDFVGKVIEATERGSVNWQNG